MMKKHKKYALPISGGLDSRAILAAIDYLGLNNQIYKAFTMGNSKCWDYLIEKEVCRRANISNELVEYDKNMAFEYEENRIKNNFEASCFYMQDHILILEV